MRSRNSLPLLFLSFTLSAVFSSILPFLLVRCSQVLMKKVRRSYSLSRLRPRFFAIFAIQFLKLLRKKYRVVRDSVIQDNFAFHTSQRFNLPRDSIHSTDCTLLYANGVSQFLASRSLSLSSRRLSLARSTRAILRLVPPLPSAAQREVFAGQFAPGRLLLHRRKPSRVQGKLNDRDSPWSFDSLI